MTQPLVSVVIATWNTAAYLSETVESALAQTWPNLEVIVVDDGSTDDTVEVLAPFRSRIRYEWRAHQGLAAARNEGIRMARGEYIALLDADDLWHPDKTAVQAEIAARHPETGLVACDGVEFAGDQLLRDHLLSAPFLGALAEAPSEEVTADFEREFVDGTGISCPSQVLIPRRVLEAVGPFIDSGAQDYDFYLRVSRQFPITLHGHRLARWRYRADAMSGDSAERPIRWGLFALPVLLDHRTRCRPEWRPLFEQRIRGLIRSLGYHVMTRGRTTGRRVATGQLLRILWAHPWPPTALLHLAGLWSPPMAFRIGARVMRPFRYRA